MDAIVTTGEPGNMLHVANAYEDGQGRIVPEDPTVGREGFQLSWNCAYVLAAVPACRRLGRRAGRRRH
ncbi:hypothetical protein [Streptomyces wuyuanensis]|uniref:Uncharacterized protein n=1 Tax=Streptomyces wuyuanensis TaxID=1196353 RepID=A0A1H0CV07_9ACTN|nr:hypothetical protein [Streptomyces wuyuanensis]SDN61743.1 hypothetical protein SAMN05444921_13141 [Streptomyces wuyuanensis]